MGLKLTIDSRELQKIVDRYREMKLRVEDIREASPGIRLLLQEDADDRFESSPPVETGGNVSGGAYWAGLSEEYLGANPRRLGGQILRDTGELQQSLTSEGHPYNVFGVDNESIVFGTALAKAERLQKKRKFLFWHDALLEKVAIFLINYYSGE